MKYNKADGKNHMDIARHHKRFFLSVLTLWFLWVCSPVSVHAQSLEKLDYLTEEYYPYSYTEYGTTKGIGVDLLHMTWKELGIQPLSIQFLPWARAYDHIQNEPSTVLFSMARTTERKNLFKWAGPITTVRFVLIAKKEKHIMLSCLDDLAGYRVGTIRKDISDIILDDYREIAQIEAVANMEQNINKLINNRLDMIAYEEQSWRRIAARFNLPADEYETVFTLQETPIYYAFHRDTRDDLVQRFQNALDRVKTSPAFQKVLDNYLK
ncbi:MAG: transporter substrate-binding domain-containing protein [Pseudodesulfovibrio sp.]|nr:transporter substrate-binding domain-containing protein [Pseudodesulfovibrio sp.]